MSTLQAPCLPHARSAAVFWPQRICHLYDTPTQQKKKNRKCHIVSPNWPKLIRLSREELVSGWRSSCNTVVEPGLRASMCCISSHHVTMGNSQPCQRPLSRPSVRGTHHYPVVWSKSICDARYQEPPIHPAFYTCCLHAIPPRTDLNVYAAEPHRPHNCRSAPKQRGPSVLGRSTSYVATTVPWSSSAVSTSIQELVCDSVSECHIQMKQ